MWINFILCCIISFLYIKPQLPSAYSNNSIGCIISFLYIKPQRYDIYLSPNKGCIISFLYIKPQPEIITRELTESCIISFLYIKPQPFALLVSDWDVVLYRFSTSNHNPFLRTLWLSSLYYIVSLHQTTTLRIYTLPKISCIISFLYIKPQLIYVSHNLFFVVLYRFSTSNHN